VEISHRRVFLNSSVSIGRWTNFSHPIHYIRSEKFSNVPRQRREFFVLSTAQTVTVVDLESKFSRTVISSTERPTMTDMNLGTS